MFGHLRSRLKTYLVSLHKRKRFVAATLFVTTPMFILSLYPFQTAIFFLPIVLILAYGATYFALLEDIKHIEWAVLFIMPIYFCVFFLLFYYLLPIRWLTRVPFAVIMCVALYAIFLSENIFNVGVGKSLPLYRAAYSIANFMTLVILFFLFTVLYSFRQHYLLNAFFGALLSWPIFFHSIWSASPRDVLEERVYKFSTILAVLLGFAILLLNFMPIKTSIYALYTVAIAYVLIGVTQEVVQNTAFREHIRAYVIMILFMTFLVLLTAQWS